MQIAIAKLLPLAVMGGIAVHSGPAIKERIGGFGGAGEKIQTKSRLTAILDAAALQVASDDEWTLESAGGFRAFVKKNVRIKGNDRADASIDPWGTPLKGQIAGRRMSVTSAGPDKKFGTRDDLSASQNIFGL